MSGLAGYVGHCNKSQRIGMHWFCFLQFYHISFVNDFFGFLGGATNVLTGMKSISDRVLFFPTFPFLSPPSHVCTQFFSGILTLICSNYDIRSSQTNVRSVCLRFVLRPCLYCSPPFSLNSIGFGSLKIAKLCHIV